MWSLCFRTHLLQCWESAVAVFYLILTYVTSAVEIAPFNNLRGPHPLNNQQSPVLQLPVFLILKHHLGRFKDWGQVPSVAGRAVVMDTSSHWSAPSTSLKTLTRYGLHAQWSPYSRIIPMDCLELWREATTVHHSRQHFISAGVYWYAYQQTCQK
jgi:hypothetical protein